MIFLRFDDGDSDCLINLQHVIKLASVAAGVMALTIDGETHMLPCSMRGFLRKMKLTTIGAAGYAIVDLGEEDEKA